jgi:alkylation response protein AidB-like acyl-CoA dehydrogenase
MHFSLNDDQAALRDGIRRYLDENHDFEARQRALAASEGLNRAAWDGLVALGLLAIDVHEENGGLGLSAIEAMLAQEELGRALAVEPIGLSALAATIIDRHGSDAHRAAWLPAIMAGETLAVIAHGEPATSGHPARLETKATPRKGGFTLSGAKSVVIGGDAANLLLVSAATADGSSLFLVPADAQGVTIKPLYLTDDRRAADIILNDVAVDAEAWLGPDAVTDAYDRMRIALCADMLGAMSKAIDLTVEYMGIRRQFGQALSEFQALQHRVADIYVEIEQARSALFAGMAALLYGDPAERPAAIAAAKAQVGFAARFVGGHAIQLHGGIGMTEEYAVGHVFRRLTVSDASLGNADTQLAMLAETILEEPETDQSVESSQSRKPEMCGASA